MDRNIRRRQLIRLKGYDYSQNGCYFVTVCSKDRKNIFSDVGTGLAPVPTLSQIMGSFKSKSSWEYLKYIKQNDLNVLGQIWQRSFHDHVIRTEKSLCEIRKYIINNPFNWEQDKNNI